MRKAIAFTVVIALVAVTAIAAFAITRPVPPDWTVASCSLWENGAHPVTPAYTYTDRCMDTDGVIVYSPFSDHVWH